MILLSVEFGTFTTWRIYDTFILCAKVYILCGIISNKGIFDIY